MSTYVISDVHAHLDEFNNFIYTLAKDDIVYCLGDVIDKGPDGLKVLQLIMKDNRFHMLLGNHELMFIDTILSMKNKSALSMGITSYYKEIWIKYNSGSETLKEFNLLPKEEQEKMLLFLKSLPILLNIQVNKRHFILVHAFPLNLGIKDIYMKDIKHEFIEELYDFNSDFVWDRQQIFIPNKTVITGHTMVQTYGYNDAICLKDKNGNEWWDIDGGLAKQDGKGSLLALKLEDMSVKKY